VPEYDQASVREALVNAMVHRDYRRPGNITIAMYPDRMEVHNPADLSADWHADVERISKPYNPNIARVFLQRGWMEGLGIGMAFIRHAAKASGAQAPRWEYDRGVLTLTLFKAAVVMSPAKSNLEKRLLELLTTPQAASTLAQAVQMSDRQLRRILSDMEALGRVQRIGKGPATRYVRL
jgi:predicted HTH transcriptional regulator